MLFAWMALWLTAAILLLSDPLRSAIRWLSALAFCGGCGALSVVVGGTLRPWTVQWAHNPLLDARLHVLQISLSNLSYYGVPYTYLLFALSYHPLRLLASRRMPIAAGGLLLPVIAMLLLTPAYPVSHPELFRLLAGWAVPYAVAGTIRILTKKEANPLMTRAHAVTSLAVVPTVLFCVLMNYVLPSLGYYEMWRYNPWVIAAAFLLFLTALFKYGFLGTQLLIERRRLDFTLRAITKGTSILNHAIKNDAGKMNLFSEKIAFYAEETGQRELAEDIAVVAAASRHIQELVMRVQDISKDLPLRPEVITVGALVRPVLKGCRLMLGEVEVVEAYEKEAALVCDPAQVREVLHNIVANAADAMPEGGCLSIRSSYTRRWLVLAVADTGAGMDRLQAKRAVEPFYTTKANPANFGLGLAYGFSVMGKHGGTLTLDSEPGAGTTVYLRFPVKER